MSFCRLVLMTSTGNTNNQLSIPHNPPDIKCTSGPELLPSFERSRFADSYDPKYIPVPNASLAISRQQESISHKI